MRTLALTILTMGIVLVAGNARAQTYDPAFPFCMHVVYPRGATYQDCTYNTTVQDRYCLQGRQMGNRGNCMFSSYAQCMATASGTNNGCGINPQYLFHQRNGTYRGRY